jgi:endonuclease/exonuclease/phosphatase (EEP) superfamily protein YafD
MLSGLSLFPVLRVDYIWYTEPIHCKSAWIGSDTGSDHLPVLARLELGRDIDPRLLLEGNAD